MFTPQEPAKSYSRVKFSDSRPESLVKRTIFACLAAVATTMGYG
jgi:hypothetical protein